MLRHVPNLLTASRLLVAALFPFSAGSTRVAFIVFALLTEFLDGFLARRFRWHSAFGVLFDPIADKLLFSAVAITLLFEGALEWWELIALGVRDASVVLAALWLLARGDARSFLRMQPRLWGKLMTVLQYAVFLCVVLSYPRPAPLMALALAVGLLATIQYFADFRRPSRQQTETDRGS